MKPATSPPATRWPRAAALCVAMLALTPAAVAGTNKVAPPPRPAAPAPKPMQAAPQPSLRQQGGVHIPGARPGQMGGLAGNQGGSPAVHLPSSMAPRPAAPTPEAPVRPPVSAARPAARRDAPVTRAGTPAGPHDRASQAAAHPGQQPAQADRAHAQPARPDTAHAQRDPRRDAPPGHEATARSPSGDARGLTEAGPRRPTLDARLGNPATLHTVGVTGADVRRAAPSAFLRHEAHRDPARDHAFVRSHEADFHTRRVAALDARELGRWRTGAWRNEWHYGRRGWWWDVGGVWYGYPEPIFPYPEDIAPLVAYDTETVDGPDMAQAELGPAQDEAPGQAPQDLPQEMAQGQPPPGAIAPLPAAPVGWYRCDQPGGYYPGLDSCTSNWALVQNAPMPGE